MRAGIRDKEALSGVSLLELASYLRAAGWSEANQQFERFSLWRHAPESGDELEIVLPRDPEAGDFVARVADALALLERAEDRSQLQILRDLTYASVDLIRLQRAVPNDRDGSISLEEGVALVENARQLIFSAACSAVAPKRVLPPRRPNQAIDYLRNLRLGQTERGSYVVTLISTVAPLLTPGERGLLELMEEPFPRRATRVLVDAVAATSHASNEAAASGSFATFEEFVPKGVSANLCEAIVGMASGESTDRSLTVSTFWAASRPYAENPRPETSFMQDSIPIIEEAARLFRESEPLQGITVLGPVVNLHRDPNSSFGVATIACVLEGKSRHVGLSLNDADYQIAIVAHRDARALAFEADVLREGRTFKAENVRDLRLLEER